jgi:UDP-N-acetylglucosamine--N-acetylmuramyl-(pentapeptide) pyrophosphoryl-undecaprenol N-acetylglucosamine transferase
MFANYAKVVTATFRTTEQALGRPVIRTGHPVRSELRQAISNRDPEENLVVVLGGSGGAKFLNEMVPQAARLLPDVRVLHSAGKSQYDRVHHLISGIEDRYDMRPYFESDVMAKVYQSGTLAIARSGSGISEFAMARMPSILVPLSTSADNHQLRNAEEFASMGAASLVNQETCTVEALASEINVWMKDKNKQESAALALSEWDVPDSTYQIWKAVKQAAQL